MCNVYSAPQGYYKCTATHVTPRGTHGGPRGVVQQISKVGYNIQGGGGLTLNPGPSDLQIAGRASERAYIYLVAISTFKYLATACSGGGSCLVAHSVRDMCVQAAVVLQARFGFCVTPQERSAVVKCFGGGAVLAHLAALC